MPLPRRSLWLGDGLTSATTEESARNADTGMTGKYSCISKNRLHVSVHRHNPRFVQKHRVETSARAGRGQGICLESGALLRPSHNGLPARAGGGGRAVNRDQQALILTKKKRPGLACANPSRLSRGRFRPNPLYA